MSASNEPTRPREGSLVLEGYEDLGLIGKGAFGTVHRVRDIENRCQYACKCVEVNVQDPSMWTEITVLKSLDSPHILKLVQVTTGKVYSSIDKLFHQKLCLVTDLADGDIGEEIAHARETGCRIPEWRCWMILVQMLYALLYCRNRKRAIDYQSLSLPDDEADDEADEALVDNHIVHRDIKPINMLRLGSGRVLLANFGLECAVKPQGFPNSFVGTPGYIAPEVQAQVTGYSTSANICSLAIAMHEVAHLQMPTIQGENVVMLRADEHISEAFMSILRLMSKPVQLGRPTPTQLLNLDTMKLYRQVYLLSELKEALKTAEIATMKAAESAKRIIRRYTSESALYPMKRVAYFPHFGTSTMLDTLLKQWDGVIQTHIVYKANNTSGAIVTFSSQSKKEAALEFFKKNPPPASPLYGQITLADGPPNVDLLRRINYCPPADSTGYEKVEPTLLISQDFRECLLELIAWNNKAPALDLFAISSICHDDAEISHLRMTHLDAPAVSPLVAVADGSQFGHNNANSVRHVTSALDALLLRNYFPQNGFRAPSTSMSTKSSSSRGAKRPRVDS